MTKFVDPAVVKTAIPSVVTSVSDPALNKIVTAMKDNIEAITGLRRGVPALTQLPANATTAQIIDAINFIIARLNYQGR